MNWQIIGHEGNKKFFNAIIGGGELSHTYLFWGQEMIGKKTFALELYRLINKREEISDADADLKILYPKTLEGETKIYIEDARDLKKFLSLRPRVGPYKCAIIDNADKLTVEASNAILKTLEEPQPHTILILISAKPKSILATIRSRCEAIRFNSVSEKSISEYLEDKKIKKEDKEFLIKTANGRIGWLINTINQNSLSDIRKSIEELGRITKQGVAEKITFSKKIFEAGDYLERINDWMNYLSSEIVNKESAKILKGLAKLYPIISEPSFNHRLALENFLINIEN